MISSVSSRVGNFVFDIQDSKKIALISLIPVIGLAWAILKQLDSDYKNVTNPSSSCLALFQWIEKKNQVKKICAYGGLVQSIVYVARCLFYGISISAAINASAFLPMTLVCSSTLYITAKINESNFKSANDIKFSNNYVW